MKRAMVAIADRPEERSETCGVVGGRKEKGRAAVVTEGEMGPANWGSKTGSRRN